MGKPSKRQQYLDLIKRLNDEQFATLRYLLGVPAAHLPPDTTPLTTRYIALLEYLEHHPQQEQDFECVVIDVLEQAPAAPAKPGQANHGQMISDNQIIGSHNILNISLGDSAPRQPSIFQHLGKLIRRLLKRGPELPQAINPTDKINLDHFPTPSTLRVGRSQELARLSRAWRNSQVSLVHIHAAGGVGKSALLYYWISKNFTANNDHQGLHKIFAWSFDDGQADSRAFFQAALRFFQRPEADNPLLKISDLANALARALSQQPCLLVLDNLELFQAATHHNDGRLTDLGLQTFFGSLKTYGLRQPGLVINLSRQPLSELQQWSAAAYRAWDLATFSPAQGAELLAQLKIHYLQQSAGQDAAGQPRTQGEAASAEWGGHALSLLLLARSLKEQYDGDIHQREQIAAQLSLGRDDLARQAQSMLDFYSEHYWADKAADDPGAVFMELIGLFDHPPSVAEMDEVLTWADHAQPLRESWRDWNKTKQELIQARLLLLSPEPRQRWDCHPLLRQRFGQHFRDTAPRAYQQAHQVLFRYYQQLPKEQQPKTLADMQPLYLAVKHGCWAGAYQAAVDLYYVRILHADLEIGKSPAYSLKVLGAYAQSLNMLSAFFPQGWQQPVQQGLSEQAQAYLLSEASACLMSLGRLAEALEPYLAALQRYQQLKDWQQASRSAQNLAVLYLPLGQLPQAQQAALQTLDYAQQAEDLWEQLASYVYLGHCQQLGGGMAAALRSFQQAERLQAEYQPEYPQLFSTYGFYYCQSLLEQAMRQALKSWLGKPQRGEAEAESAWTAACAQIQQRVETALAIAQRNEWLLDVALDQLTLANLQHLQQAPGAEQTYRSAAQAIRDAGVINFTPIFLIDQSAFYLQQAASSVEDGEAETTATTAQGNSPQSWLEKAAAPLEELDTLIQRCGMRLYEVELFLLKAEQARLQGHTEQAQQYQQDGETLAQQLGYACKLLPYEVLEAFYLAAEQKEAE